jgi:hypothetical protein
MSHTVSAAAYFARKALKSKHLTMSRFATQKPAKETTGVNPVGYLDSFSVCREGKNETIQSQSSGPS